MSFRESEESRSGSAELGDFIVDPDVSIVEQAFQQKGVKARYRGGQGKRRPPSFQRSKKKHQKHSRALQNYDTYEYLSGVNLGSDSYPYLRESSSLQNNIARNVIEEGQETFGISYEFEPPPTKDSVELHLKSIAQCIESLTTFQMIAIEPEIQVQNATQIMACAVEAIGKVAEDLFLASAEEFEKITDYAEQVMRGGVVALAKFVQEEKKNQSWDEILDCFYNILEEIFKIQKLFESTKADRWDISDIVELFVQEFWVFVSECQEDLLIPQNINPESIFVHSVQERAKSMKRIWRKGFEMIQRLLNAWSQYKCIFRFQWAMILRNAAIQIELMQHWVPGWDDVENSPFLRTSTQEPSFDQDDEYSDEEVTSPNFNNNNYNNSNNNSMQVPVIKEIVSGSYVGTSTDTNTDQNDDYDINTEGGILSSTYIPPKQQKVDADSAWFVPTPTSPIFDDKLMEAHAWLVDILEVLYREAAHVALEIEHDPDCVDMFNPELKNLMEQLQCNNMNDFLADFRLKFSELAVTSLGCALALSSNLSCLAFWALQKLEEHCKSCLALVKRYDKSELGIARILNRSSDVIKRDNQFRKLWSRAVKIQTKKLRNYYQGLWNALFKVKQLVTVRSRKQKEYQSKLGQHVGHAEKFQRQVKEIPDQRKDIQLASSPQANDILSTSPFDVVMYGRGSAQTSPEAPERNAFENVMKQQPLFKMSYRKMQDPNQMQDVSAQKRVGEFQQRNFVQQMGSTEVKPLAPSPFVGSSKPPPSPFVAATQPASSPFSNQRPKFAFTKPIAYPKQADDAATDISDMTASTATTNTTVQSWGSNVPAFVTASARNSSSNVSEELENQINELMQKGGDFWNRSLKDIRIIRSLNSGAFAMVFKVRWEPSGIEVALKHVALKEYGVDEEVVRQFIKEAKIYKQLSYPRHENVMHCYGVCIEMESRRGKEDPRISSNEQRDDSDLGRLIPSNGLRFGLLLEYCEVGTVMELIKEARQYYRSQNKMFQQFNQKYDWENMAKLPRAPTTISDPEILLYYSWRMRFDLAIQIARGLQHMHSKNVVHRDLTSYNVMLKMSNDRRRLVCKVGDFNLSKYLKYMQPQINSIEIVSPEWQAHEVIQGEAYSRESDVFSFGVILWELVTLRTPWGDDYEESRCNKCVVIGRRMFNPSDEHLELTKDAIYGIPLIKPVFDRVASMIRRCQDRTKFSRPTLEQIIADLTEVRDMFEEDDLLS
eukprot:TRINITY_DN9878_c0_g1_i5.p1 TRINITY_DN9878_c0_g1~~TRINITY_DN9878_c0_g1_i5.p1  ORF type:complete len:1226 (-),score=163.94 TRINITY_DN9878_c0_g1_i5:2141-5818(-)